MNLLKKSRDMDENSSALIAEKGEDMAEAVKRLWDLRKMNQHWNIFTLRRKTKGSGLEYKWEEGIKKGEKQGKAEGMEKGIKRNGKRKS